MAFMEPDEYFGDYLSIDGPEGTEFLPCDVEDLPDDELERWSSRDGLKDIPDVIRPFCGNRKAWTIERGRGSLSRYSASGYLGRTEWQPGNADDLAESYDVCPTCHEQCWDTDKPCESEEVK